MLLSVRISILLSFLSNELTGELIGVEPKYMGVGPIPAILRVLAQEGLSKEDIDVWEVCIDSLHACE